MNKYPWDPESPHCRNCGDSLYLMDGSEWPDDKSLVLCHNCALAAVEKARKKILALHAEVAALKALRESKWIPDETQREIETLTRERDEARALCVKGRRACGSR